MGGPYRVALTAIIVVAVAAAVVLSRRYGRPDAGVPRSADPPAIARALLVGGLAFYAGLLAFILRPSLLAWSALGLPAAARWAGLPLVAGGFGLSMWARFTLGRNATVTSVPAPDARLVTAGPYRRLRHPIYTGGLLAVAGGTLVTDSALVLAAGLLVLGVIDVRTRREERLLLDRYGDAYRRHMARTRRWLPRLFP